MKTQTVKKVWHIGAWNRNVGDWAMAYQLHRSLNEQAEKSGYHFEFYMIDSQRTYFHPDLVDQMNEDADLVIIGGGGLIFNRPEDNSLSGWSFNIAPEDLRRITVPIVVYAIGFNQFPFDHRRFPNLTGQHLRLLQEKSFLFATRNLGTKQALVELFGLDENRIATVPDPGMAFYDRNLRFPELQEQHPLIAFNFAGDRPEQRFQQPFEENQNYFLGNLKNALLRLVEEHNAHVLFFPHLMHVDSDYYQTFKVGFPKNSISSTHELFPFLYPPPGEMLYPHIPFFTNLYRRPDVVLGMRLHSCILAFGAGTKFIPVGAHRKLGYFMEETGAPEQYKIPMLQRSADTEEAIYQKIRNCLDDQNYERLLQQSLAKQLEVLRQFNLQILQLFLKEKRNDALGHRVSTHF